MPRKPSVAKIAAECLTHPTVESFWHHHQQRYVNSDQPVAYSQAKEAHVAAEALPSIRLDPKFKLVFLTAAIGTLLFTLICVGLHLLTSGEPPPARKELIEGLLTMAKVGFGAIVGLLGGKKL